MHFDFSELNDYVLLGPKRTGTSFLEGILELDRKFTQGGFLKEIGIPKDANDRYITSEISNVDWEQYRTPFAMYRYHIKSDALPASYFDRFIAKVVREAEKVVVNRRFDAFKKALSDYIRHPNRVETREESVRVLSETIIDIPKLIDLYHIHRSHALYFEMFIDKHVPPEKRIDISYNLIADKQRDIAGYLSEQIGIPLTLHPKWHWYTTQYHLIPNINEVLQAFNRDSLEERTHYLHDLP